MKGNEPLPKRQIKALNKHDKIPKFSKWQHELRGGRDTLTLKALRRCMCEFTQVSCSAGRANHHMTTIKNHMMMYERATALYIYYILAADGKARSHSVRADKGKIKHILLSNEGKKKKKRYHHTQQTRRNKHKNSTTRGVNYCCTYLLLWSMMHRHQVRVEYTKRGKNYQLCQEEQRKRSAIFYFNETTKIYNKRGDKNGGEQNPTSTIIYICRKDACHVTVCTNYVVDAFTWFSSENIILVQQGVFYLFYVHISIPR